jgi:hypothetical protein
METTEIIQRKENFKQVCVWPGTTMGDSKPEEFEEFFMENFETRTQFLEEVTTLPDRNEMGDIIPETGGRIDILFAVHDEDISKFSVSRLSMGIRWIEDAVSNINNPNGIIYDERILQYKEWEA